MIPALREIGEYARGKHPIIDELDSVIENPNENGKYNNVLYLKFTVQDKIVTFDGKELEEFSFDKLKRYLYKKGTSGGGNFTPTLLYTGDIEKSLRNINKPIKKVESTNFQSLSNFLSNDNNIKNIAGELSDELQSKQGYIITLILNGKYLNEYPEVTSQLNSLNDSKYYDKYDGISKAEDKHCFVCGKKTSEVYGFVNTFNFTTFDKDGMVTGGFDKNKTWKNYPVCPNCSEALESGRSYLEKNLKGYFAGLNYFVIPKMNFQNSEATENIKPFERRVELSLKEENRKKLTNDEKDIFEALSKFGNKMSLNFMVYKEVKSAFNILLYIEDVLRRIQAQSATKPSYTFSGVR
jgi:CRISPR-associated protein Csh1